LIELLKNENTFNIE
jgi:hypothetical protein